MPQGKKPEHYQKLMTQHPEYMQAVEALGRAVQSAGPLDPKTLQLIQLGAAAAQRAEGSTLSHARRALAAGASLEEIRHALIALTSTIGFPSVAAALSWVEKELG